jgi:hypothetical protein
MRVEKRYHFPGNDETKRELTIVRNKAIKALDRLRKARSSPIERLKFLSDDSPEQDPHQNA